jgi:superoxide dismutase, Cu-Zn family
MTTNSKLATRLLLTVSIITAVLAVGTTRASAQWRAGARRAVLADAQGEVVGIVRFWNTWRGKVAVRVSILMATPGFHGIHIHSNADDLGCVAPEFTSVGPHFVVQDASHGDHAGDMPSVLVNADGTGELRFVTDQFTLADIDHRAVILHAQADNFGHVPTGTAPTEYTPNSPEATTLTQSTGNAGARIACGVVE